ncbi:MAG: polysaccharide pyruvyl transferase family protein [Gemmatimonadota bacterium]
MPAARLGEALQPAVRELAGGTGPSAGPVPGAGAGRRIALLAHSGKRNFGDEMLFASALAYYRDRLPLARFVSFTMDAVDTAERYAMDEAFRVRPEPPTPPAGPVPRALAGRLVRALRWRAARLRREIRFTRESLRRLRGTDLLLVPGSSQLIDAYGGPWAFPFTLLRWTVLARLLGVPICFLSMGAEEMERPLSRWMTRRTIGLARYVSVRDPVSRARLVQQGVRRRLPVTPDLALGYPGPTTTKTGPRREVTVGINPIPYFNRAYWRAVDEGRYRRYLDALAGLAANALERGDRVVLFPTTPWADGVAVDDIYEELCRSLGSGSLQRVSRPDVQSLEDVLAVVSRLDRVVASRYHGTAIALFLRKPVVALAYEDKTIDLMDSHGLRHFAVAIEDADADRLCRLLRRLGEEEAKVRAQLEAAVDRDRAAVHAQFETMLRVSGITAGESWS